MSTPTRTSRPTPLSVSRPSAPLPQPAVEALARLERAFLPVPLDVVRAVARYEAESARFDELMARPASELSPAEVDAFGEARQAIAESLGTLADHGRLDLIGPAETASRYRQASAHCRHFAACADFDGCLEAQDEMRDCLSRLSSVGRLDLIGGA